MRSSEVSLFENEKTIMMRIFWFVSSALLFLLIFQPLPASEQKEVKRILVLHSEISGRLSSFKELGRESAGMALRIMGVKPLVPFLSTESRHISPLFDWR
jgi:hypothetical protein